MIPLDIIVMSLEGDMDTKIEDQFWLDQGYRYVDGVLRNQVYINNLSWRNPDKYKKIEPEAYKEFEDMGCYKKEA